MNFNERVAVVTGGASGIGAAVSLRLAEVGVKVAVWDINADGADELAATIESNGGTAKGFVVDSSSWDAVREATASVTSTFGPPTLLANCAGTTSDLDNLMEITEDRWRRVLSINLDGPMFTMAEIGRVMSTNGGGSIVNIASLAALTGYPRSAAYSASKAGLVGLGKSAAVDLSRFQIRVNTICPGPTSTPMLQASWKRSGGTAAASAARSLLGSVGTAEQIAELAFFLLSDASSNITGQVIASDGGEVINANQAAVLKARS